MAKRVDPNIYDPLFEKRVLIVPRPRPAHGGSNADGSGSFQAADRRSGEEAGQTITATLTFKVHSTVAHRCHVVEKALADRKGKERSKGASGSNLWGHMYTSYVITNRGSGHRAD